MSATTKDRRKQLLGSSAWNGLDFVEIANPEQTRLLVHFLNLVPLAAAPHPTITGGETIPTVVVAPVQPSDFSVDDGHLVLALAASAPGDFSTYTLTITDPAIDRYFDHVAFSFKAGCPSDLDCEAPAPVCPPLSGDFPPIDYLAKDFLSFRQALLDFSALRYPDWQERSEADFGIMFAEALAALGDNLSYLQDRVSAEATLDTATQRRSVLRHARLVDYEPRPTLSAAVLLQLDVGDAIAAVPDGLAAIASGPDGTPILFETGDSLASRLLDPSTGIPLPAPPIRPVSATWNRGRVQPYWWDDSERCLRRGATEMWVLGHGFGFTPGQALLIDTEAAVSADPPIRQIVQLIGSEEVCDPLSLHAVPGPEDPPGPPFLVCATSPPATDFAPTATTRVFWRSEDALLADHDLRRTQLAGNIVPATQGRTITGERFGIAAAPVAVDPIPLAVIRTGSDSTPNQPIWQYLYPLQAAPLAWLAPQVGTGPVPEIVLHQLTGDPPPQWQWRRRLLDADVFETAFTLDPAAFRPIARFPRSPALPNGAIASDYDGDAGDTIRFGDGTFGEIPEDGAIFAASYRVGAGSAGNVGIGAINRVDPTATGILAVTNPLPATGGNDPEPLDQVRRLAPQAFRAGPPLRALRAEDYRTIAETLPWVQRAGTVFRWTGSWLTVFTTPDPRGTDQVTLAQQTELIELLNRRRVAGYESYVPAPIYVPLDLTVQVCARPDAFRGDVESGIIAALTQGLAGVPAFFGPDNFTFGSPLERSALEAAVQGVYGVAGVTCLQYRVRGRTPRFVELPDVLTVGADEILRLDNDPSRPGNGTLRITVLGGK